MKKYLYMMTLSSLLFACVGNRAFINQHRLLNTNSPSIISVSSKTGIISYDSNYVMAKKAYDLQPDTIKQYLLFSRDGSYAYFVLTDETSGMIKELGGIKSIVEKCLSRNTYSQVNNQAQLKYYFIMRSKGEILSLGVELFKIGQNAAINLNSKEIEKLLEFGRRLKFNYKGYYDDDYILNIGYVFPLK